MLTTLAQNLYKARCSISWQFISRQTFIESKSSCSLSSVCRHGSSIFPSFSNLRVSKSFSNSCFYSKDVTVNSANLKSKIGKNEIDYNEFEHYRLKSNAIIIDVRSPEELTKNGMVPNTINIPISQIADYFHGEETSRFEDEFGLSFPTAEDPIIVFCKMGVRSEMARKILVSGTVPSSGRIYKNVASYPGSFDEWSALASGSEQ